MRTPPKLPSAPEQQLSTVVPRSPTQFPAASCRSASENRTSLGGCYPRNPIRTGSTPCIPDDGVRGRAIPARSAALPLKSVECAELHPSHASVHAQASSKPTVLTFLAADP